jgi:hypothetical protein
MSYSSVAYESAVPAAGAAVPTTKTVIKGLQNAINRFFGSALGAPIDTDGILGNQTLAAVKSIISWMPDDGFDPSVVTTLVGASPTINSISQRAAQLSNLLDAMAAQRDYDVGVTPDPPSVTFVPSARGKVPQGPIPKGKSQQNAAGLLGLGLPNWAVYGGGAALALAVAMLVVKKKRSAAIAGW